MTTIRSQQDRYWIQIDVEPNGENVGHEDIDLSMVDKVYFVRDPHDNTTVKGVKITYAGTMAPFAYVDERARFFEQEWNRYRKLQATGAKAAPGLIQTANNFASIEKGLKR